MVGAQHFGRSPEPKWTPLSFDPSGRMKKQTSLISLRIRDRDQMKAEKPPQPRAGSPSPDLHSPGSRPVRLDPVHGSTLVAAPTPLLRLSSGSVGFGQEEGAFPLRGPSISFARAASPRRGSGLSGPALRQPVRLILGFSQQAWSPLWPGKGRRLRQRCLRGASAHHWIRTTPSVASWINRRVRSVGLGSASYSSLWRLGIGRGTAFAKSLIVSPWRSQ